MTAEQFKQKVVEQLEAEIVQMHAEIRDLTQRMEAEIEQLIAQMHAETRDLLQWIRAFTMAVEMVDETPTEEVQDGE